MPSGDLIGALGGCPFWVEEPRAGAVNYATLYPVFFHINPTKCAISIGPSATMPADYNISFDVTTSKPGGVLHAQVVHFMQDFSGPPDVALQKTIIRFSGQRVYLSLKTKVGGFAGFGLELRTSYSNGSFGITNLVVADGADPQEYGYGDDWKNNTRTTHAGVKRNLGEYLSQIVSWSGLSVADIANYGTAGRGAMNYQTSNAQPRELQLVATLAGDGDANSYAKARAKLENLLLRYDPITRKNRAIRFHFQMPDGCGGYQGPRYVFEARYVGDGLQQTYTNDVGELLSLRFELSTPIMAAGDTTATLSVTAANGSTTNVMRRLANGEYVPVPGSPGVPIGSCELPDGRIAFSFASTTLGVSIYSPADNTWFSSATGPAATGAGRKIVVDAAGRIWSGCGSTVLAYYTIASNTWTIVTHGVGTISSLLATKSGNIYIAGNTSPFLQMWDSVTNTIVAVPGITVNGSVHMMTESCGGRVFVVGGMTTPFSGSFFYNFVSRSATAGNATSPASGGYLEMSTHPQTCEIYADGGASWFVKYNGGAFATVGAGVNNQVRGITFSRNGDVFIGGKFTANGTKPLYWFARISSGIYYREPVTMTGSTVWTMLTAVDGSIYAAGDFTATYSTSASLSISYCGSEAANPTIEIVGTGTGAQIYSISNETSGVNLLFNPLTVGAGETVTIDTRRGTIKSSYGGTVTGALSGGSAVTSFRLLPPDDSECCRTNTIKVLALSGTCTVNVRYKTQYKSVNSGAICE